MSGIRPVVSGVAVGSAVGAVVGVACWVGLGSSAWVLVPWALAGLAVGRFQAGAALPAGAAYGFALSAGYLIAGYSGTEPVVTKLPGFGVLALFGGVCGAALGSAGGRRR